MGLFLAHLVVTAGFLLIIANLIDYIDSLQRERPPVEK